jgi:hypothetical protein
MKKELSPIDQPTLLLTGLFATAIAWCYRLFAAASSTIHDENQGDTGPSQKINDQPLIPENIKALAVPTFAWETAPIAKQDEKLSVGTLSASNSSNQQNTSPPERLITTRHITGDKEAEKTLEFFASMTFANGGLRAPSCPCCQ